MMNIMLYIFVVLGINSILFLIGLKWTHSSRPITIWKPAIYLTVVMILDLPLFLSPPSLVTETVNTFCGVCFFLIGAIFTAITAFLWQKLFKATKWRAFESALLTGFVNAVFYILSVPIIKG